MLSIGLYFNELIYRLLPAHVPAFNVYSVYQSLLSELIHVDQELIHYWLLCTEIKLLKALEILQLTGYDSDSQQSISHNHVYYYVLDEGVKLNKPLNSWAISVSGGVLKGMRMAPITITDWFETRQFINHVINASLKGKPLNSRTLVARYLEHY